MHFALSILHTLAKRVEYLSRLVRKRTICIGENKDADQLRGKADQRLCFLYMNSTLTLLLKSKISSFKPVSVTAQTGLCRTCSETTLLVFPRGGSFLSNEKKTQYPIMAKYTYWNLLVHFKSKYMYRI